MVKFHHLGFFFSMVFKSKRFATSVLGTDVTGKSHSFFIAPYATVFDLRSQMNSKFNITSDLYWLSNRGKPLHDFVSLKEISGAVIMNGRLTGGAKCYFRGVKMMQVHANLTASLEDMKLSVALKTLLGTWKMLKI